MKKKSIKSLELNKKTISNLETFEITGGAIFPSIICIYTPVIIVTDAAIDGIIEGWEASADA